MAGRFDFYGKHLLLTFSRCRVDLDDMELIRRDMITAIESVGATIISYVEHRFQPHGLSIVFLLSESHASIHTYPETGACFLDLFTCGRRLEVDRFGDTLRELWQPLDVSRVLNERCD